MTVNGSGFTNVQAMKFNGKLASPWIVQSPTKLLARVRLVDDRADLRDNERRHRCERVELHGDRRRHHPTASASTTAASAPTASAGAVADELHAGRVDR